MGIKLIIVDDAPFIREVLRHVFSGTDVEIVAEAVNGEQAVKEVLKRRPDVVLMDIVMPQMSGIEATRKILEEWPEAKIVACSTLDQNTMVDRALEVGCCHYLVKPFEAHEVIKVVQDLAKAP